MNPRWRRRSLFAGLAVLAITIAIVPWNPTRGCGPASATPPIIAFELATDRADLAALFGPPGPCRTALAADLGIVNTVDYLFMAMYGTLLAAALLGLGLRRGFVALAIAAVLADAVENLALFQLDLDSPGRWLAVLTVASRTKFVLLGLVSATLAVATWRREAGWRRWLALAHVPTLPITIAGSLLPAVQPELTPALAFSWLAIIVWAALPARPAAPR